MKRIRSHEERKHEKHMRRLKEAVANFNAQQSEGENSPSRYTRKEEGLVHLAEARAEAFTSR